MKAKRKRKSDGEVCGNETENDLDAFLNSDVNRTKARMQAKHWKAVENNHKYANALKAYANFHCMSSSEGTWVITIT